MMRLFGRSANSRFIILDQKNETELFVLRGCEKTKVYIIYVIDKKAWFFHGTANDQKTYDGYLETIQDAGFSWLKQLLQDKSKCNLLEEQQAQVKKAVLFALGFLQKPKVLISSVAAGASINTGKYVASNCYLTYVAARNDWHLWGRKVGGALVNGYLEDIIDPDIKSFKEYMDGKIYRNILADNQGKTSKILVYLGFESTVAGMFGELASSTNPSMPRAFDRMFGRSSCSIPKAALDFEEQESEGKGGHVNHQEILACKDRKECERLIGVWLGLVPGGRTVDEQIIGNKYGYDMPLLSLAYREENYVLADVLLHKHKAKTTIQDAQRRFSEFYNKSVYLDRSQFVDAIAEGWYYSVIAAVEYKHINFQMQNSYGNTLVHWAAANGEMELLQLAQAGTTWQTIKDQVNGAKETPLCQAVKRGKINAARFLLENGAGPNLGNPLKIAVEQNSPLFFKLLLAYSAGGIPIKIQADQIAIKRAREFYKKFSSFVMKLIDVEKCIDVKDIKQVDQYYDCLQSEFNELFRDDRIFAHMLLLGVIRDQEEDLNSLPKLSVEALYGWVKSKFVIATGDLEMREALWRLTQVKFLMERTQVPEVEMERVIGDWIVALAMRYDAELPFTEMSLSLLALFVGWYFGVRDEGGRTVSNKLSFKGKWPAISTRLANECEERGLTNLAAGLRAEAEAEAERVARAGGPGAPAAAAAASVEEPAGDDGPAPPPPPPSPPSP
ncbi:MAG: ankyrin repeat domain-containing protein [Gammaproteobacteria bacterium]|nr:ankyrin repeat domain-containing protein [Gammaproteobacteria bacterium]